MTKPGAVTGTTCWAGREERKAGVKPATTGAVPDDRVMGTDGFGKTDPIGDGAVDVVDK